MEEPGLRGLRTLLGVLAAGTLMVLSGVGLGTVGATVIGVDRLGDLRRHVGTAAPGPSAPAASGSSRASSGAPAPATSATAPARRGSSAANARAVLGVEAVDAAAGGALVVGVHVPGPGCAAGLVRGDVLLAVNGRRVRSAADLANAVAAVRAGSTVTLTVRHTDGTRRQVTATPAVVT